MSGGGTVPCGADPPDVTAEPDVCQELDRWDGDLTSLMTSDRTVTAHFDHDGSRRTLTVRASPPEGGMVGGSGSYLCGTVATATATANAGWRLVRWSPAARVRMTRSGSVTAYFERTVRPTYSLTVTESGCCGSVSVSPSGSQHDSAASIDVEVYDAATGAAYIVRGQSGSLGLRGGPEAAERVIAIACSLFWSESECAQP